MMLIIIFYSRILKKMMHLIILPKKEVGYTRSQ